MSVHYLHFDAAEDIARLGALMKVNPPIRNGMREPLWQELQRDGCEFVSSDHSAWPLARKQVASSFYAPAGIPGLETLLPAFFTGLAKRGLDAPRLCSLYLAERPARFFGLWPRKGHLSPGADGDIVVVRTAPYQFDASKTHDGLQWSPFDGEMFAASASATFVRGKLAWDGSVIKSQVGGGEFVPRQNNRGV
ncbi:hypothetical protein EN935_27085 [Mesorhizobium sp. M7D.F.Ca.US.004.03.1.1]|nr:hypothetical protein EN935_27085 [Mesorhizobium sp. M7D.F.Ca.US.004.03.1.1]